MFGAQGLLQALDAWEQLLEVPRDHAGVFLHTKQALWSFHPSPWPRLLNFKSSAMVGEILVSHKEQNEGRREL